MKPRSNCQKWWKPPAGVTRDRAVGATRVALAYLSLQSEGEAAATGQGSGPRGRARVRIACAARNARLEDRLSIALCTTAARDQSCGAHQQLMVVMDFSDFFFKQKTAYEIQV